MKYMMNTTFRTNKYLIKPNAEQKKTIAEIMDQCCFIKNCYIDDLSNNLEFPKKAKDLLAQYKLKYPNFVAIDNSALINVLFKLADGRMPKYKSKHLYSYTTTNLYKQSIYIINEQKIYIPKLGTVNINIYRPLPKLSQIYTATITKDKTNRYYVCICFSIPKNFSEKEIDTDNSIGLDYSAPHFFVDDRGNKINMPRFYKNEEERLSKLNQELNKHNKGSQNYKKVVYKINKIYTSIKNRRSDFLHKLSTKIVNEYDLICIENLRLQEMVESKYSLQRSTYENSFAKFVEMLEYKAESKGKCVVKVGRYYPSSKTCHVCGYVNKGLTLDDRKWKCPKCNTILDRDINSAINIRNQGIEIYNSRRISG